LCTIQDSSFSSVWLGSPDVIYWTKRESWLFRVVLVEIWRSTCCCWFQITLARNWEADRQDWGLESMIRMKSWSGLDNFPFKFYRENYTANLSLWILVLKST
jgi:hypothetical protein